MRELGESSTVQALCPRRSRSWQDAKHTWTNSPVHKEHSQLEDSGHDSRKLCAYGHPLNYPFNQPKFTRPYAR